MLVLLLDQRNYEALIKQFQMHFHLFKCSFEQMGSGQGGSANSFSLKLAHQKIEEIKWRSNWHKIIAEMLKDQPVLFGGMNDNVYMGSG